MREFQEAQEVQEAQETRRVIPFTEAAQRIGRSETWLRQKIREGEVPAVKIGRRWFLPEEAVEGMRSQIQSQVPDGYVPVLRLMRVVAVHPGTLVRWCREGRIPAKKIAGKWYVREVDFQKMLSGNKE